MARRKTISDAEVLSAAARLIEITGASGRNQATVAARKQSWT